MISGVQLGLDTLELRRLQLDLLFRYKIVFGLVNDAQICRARLRPKQSSDANVNLAANRRLRNMASGGLYAMPRLTANVSGVWNTG